MAAMDTANRLHQLQQTLGQAQGLGVGGSSGSGSGSPKKRSMLDAPLSTPREGGAAAARSSAGPRKGGGNYGSGSKKPRNVNRSKNGSGGGKSNLGGQNGSITKPRNGNRSKNGSGGGNDKNAASSGVNSDRPPPVVCSAFATLASRIRQMPPSPLEDLAKERIGDLSCVPYTYMYGIGTSTPTAASASTGSTANDRRIVVITDAAGSQSSVASIRAELQQQQQQQQSAFQFLGFDVEIKPKFHKGGTPNPVALIQLATQTTAYLFRVKFQGMRAHGGGAGAGAGAPSGGGGGAWTPELRHLLSDAATIKVGVGIHNDVRTLQDTYGAQVCGDATSYLDLTGLIKVKWPLIRRCGLRNLAATVLGWRLSKAQQMKNWEVKEMTNAMMEYAAADAFVALDLLEAIVT